MSGDVHGRLSALFGEVCDLPPGERETFIASIERDDPELGAALREALSELVTPSTFLGSSAPELLLAPPEPPPRIARYRLISLLGAGGMGRVYLAEQTAPRRRVALKIVEESRMTEDGLFRFEREAEFLGRLDDPGIARVLEAGRESTPNGTFRFIAMEYVEGEPFAPRDASKAIETIEETARALESAHALGIVHRDVKPPNVIVRADGRPVIVDFGIARDLDSMTALTETGAALGTPAYMAPEQIEGRGIVDARADVWSLGVMLYEAVAGRSPFDAPTRAGQVHAILRRSPDRLPAGTPRDLQVIVDVALAKDAALRYSSAGALAEDLARHRTGRPLAVRPPGAAVRAMSWMRRNPALSTAGAMAAGLLLIAAAALGYLAANWGDLEEGRKAVARRALDHELELAWLDHAGGRRADAIRALEALPPAPEVRSSLAAMRALATGDAAALEAAGADDPAFASYLRGISEIQDARSGDDEAHLRARAAFDAAIIRSRHPRALYHVTRLHSLAARRELPELRADIADLLERFPDSLAAHAAAAGALVHAAPREAVDLYRKLRERWPREPALENGLSLALLRIGRRDEALSVARALVASHPDLAAPRRTLANFLALGGELEEARPLAERAVALAPDDAEAHHVLGDIELARRRPDVALPCFETAARLAPRRVPTLVKLARLLRDAGRADEALALLERACRLEPLRGDLHADRGAVLLILGRTEEAASACQEAVRRNPADADALTNLAAARRMTGSLHTAIVHARAATAIEPSTPETWIVLGLAHLELNQAEPALEALERADTLGRRRGAWGHDTPTMIRDARALQDPERELPEWIVESRSIARSLAADDLPAATAAAERLSAGLEDEADEGRTPDAKLARRLRILRDDPALARLRTSEILGRASPEQETRIRRALRRLDALAEDLHD